MSRLGVLFFLPVLALGFPRTMGVGEKLPENLRKLVGKQGAILVLLPSASGCDPCQRRLAELQQMRERMQSAGLASIALVGDTATEHISEEATLVADGSGVIAARYSPRQDTIRGILVERFGFIPEYLRQEIAGKRLEATVAASDATAAPGERIALSIEVRLKPNMHVYAPGIEGYLPITWALADVPGWKASDIVFPKPEKLYLPAIDETVVAYSGTFRLLRTVTIASQAEGTMDVTGILRYQACDDTMCYIPDKLPVQWPVRLVH